MILNKLIQRVQSAYSKGVQSDDSRLSPRHIYNKLVTVRSRLVSQKAKKKQKTSQWNYQTIPCIEMIKAPVHECPCLPPIGCEIYRTKEQLPEPLVNLTGHLIQSVTTIDGSIIFSEIEWVEKKYKSSNKYTGSKPDYYIRNKYLYITQKKGASIISVTGLFEDPLEVEQYPSYCDEDCTDCDDCSSPLDMDFPIDPDLIEPLIEVAKIELVDEFNQRIEDTRNNTRDTQQEGTK